MTWKLVLRFPEVPPWTYTTLNVDCSWGWGPLDVESHQLHKFGTLYFGTAARGRQATNTTVDKKGRTTTRDADTIRYRGGTSLPPNLTNHHPWSE